jgi:hypothetical protein
MVRFTRRLRFVVSACALLLSGASIAVESSSAQQPPKKPPVAPIVTGVEVQPVKTLLDQPCPVVLVFRGVITTARPATVRYTWVDSRGRTWPEHQRKFVHPGTNVVTHRWKQGKPGKTIDEWVELKVLFPETRSSGKLPVHFTCGK